jgi:putative ABC transport system permease protein
VLGLVLGETMRLAVVGLVVGVALSFAFHRVVESMLFGVAAADVVTCAGVVGCVCGITLAAAWIPARRAMGVAPVEALREE